ncbi:nucleoside hydrolase [Bifidobacterium sp. 82T24]|uniref:nucleoside hydrolase n=1 Tax=Bifidobacterium pluvialisilvae TaxID=2834436 RepID=UPI001C582EEF|nr:nucleoside hydrolase [Bifidobacterium pluvialisilvae]MBW3088178.1 nucleoside hydrolase [Bifidobacterium pluvialisilvae]
MANLAKAERDAGCRRRVIIDTDCGSDDAMAIAMALNDPGCEIMMFTTVAGNVPVDQAVDNVLTTLEHVGTYEPPVYRGSESMLFNELVYAYETHGHDGMGDIGLRPRRLRASDGNAVLRMLGALESNEPHSIDLITLGPLTNIALAIKLAPATMARVRRIVAMGGTGFGPGNVTPIAEFNVWQDAEAARIVVESGLPDIMFVGWDACLGKCMLGPGEIEEIRRGGGLGRFAIDCNRNLMELNRQRFGEPCLDMADPAALAAALHPGCIAECDAYYMQVDTCNGPGYGATIIDRNRFTSNAPNVRICSRLDPMSYKSYIYRTLHVGEYRNH